MLALPLAVWGMVACAGEASPPQPPFEAPFSLDKGNEVVEVDIRVVEPRPYTFGFKFFVNRGDPADARRVLKLVGDSKRDRQAKYVDLGEPLTVRLQVRSQNKTSGAFEFDKTESEVAVYAGGFGSYSKRIADISLAPGVYRVRVENLRAAPAFAGTPINFHIYPSYLGK